MNKPVTLKHIVSRILTDEKLMKEHPENEAMLLRRHMNKQKELLVSCCLKHKNDPTLGRLEL